jgi:hypothetical protein
VPAPYIPELICGPPYDTGVSSEYRKLGTIFRISGFIPATEAQNVAVLISTELHIVISYESPVFLLAHDCGCGFDSSISLQEISSLFATCITRVTLTIAAIIMNALRQRTLRRLIFCLVVICRLTERRQS